MSEILALLAPYAMRIALYASIVTAAGGGFLYFKVHYENVGRDKAIAAIAAKDEGALNAVKDARKTVDDCYGSGGGWDVTDGVCQH